MAGKLLWRLLYYWTRELWIRLIYFSSQNCGFVLFAQSDIYISFDLPTFFFIDLQFYNKLNHHLGNSWTLSNHLWNTAFSATCSVFTARSLVILYVDDTWCSLLCVVADPSCPPAAAVSREALPLAASHCHRRLFAVCCQHAGHPRPKHSRHFWHHRWEIGWRMWLSEFSSATFTVIQVLMSLKGSDHEKQTFSAL